MKKRGRFVCVVAVLAIQLLYVYGYDHVNIISIIIIPISTVLFYLLGLQYDKAAYYANKDLLTNLYNRRFVENMFPKLRSTSGKTKKRLFVLFVDCDNFKQINDCFSHQTGDQVLCKLGQILEKQAEPDDIVARWGGDEFLVLGLRDNPERIDNFVVSIKNEIKRDISLSKEMPISVSIGVAIAPDNHVTLNGLLHIADQNMYNQKNDVTY